MKRRKIVVVALCIFLVIGMNAYVCYATDITQPGGPKGEHIMKASELTDYVRVAVPYEVLKTKYRTQPGGGTEVVGYMKATIKPGSAYVKRAFSCVPLVFTIDASVVSGSDNIYTNGTTTLTVEAYVQVKKTYIGNYYQSTSQRFAHDSFVPER